MIGRRLWPWLVLGLLLAAGCGAVPGPEPAMTRPPDGSPAIPLELLLTANADLANSGPASATPHDPGPSGAGQSSRASESVGPERSPAPIDRTLTATPDSPPDLSFLAAVIDQDLAEFTGRGGLASYYIADLSRHGVIRREPDLAVAGMSLVKIPILVETYRRLTGAPGIYVTGLITQTATLSGNYTANLLLGLISGRDDPYLGADLVTAALRGLGLYNSFIALPYDSEPRPGRATTYLTPANTRLDRTTRPDPNMQTTAGDLGLLLTWIYQCRQGAGPLLTSGHDGLTPDDCRSVLEMMAQNQIGSLLEAGLPDGMPLAHKHGWIGDTHGDAGIVFSPGGDYVIVILLYYPDWLAWDVSAPLIARVSARAYRHFNDPAAYPPDYSPPPTPLAPEMPTPVGPPAIVTGTAGAGLTLRDAPGGRELQVLPEGTVVTLLPDSPAVAGNFTWRRIMTGSGAVGWVGEAFLLLGEEEP